LAVASLLTFGLCVSAAAAENIVTPEKLFPQLDALIKQSVGQSPRMVSRAIDLEIADADKQVAKAGMLPSVNGYYRYLQSSDTRADLGGGRSQVAKQYYDLSLNQPLFYWGERRNTARMGEIRQNLAKGQYREAYRLLAIEIRSVYFRLITDKVRLRKAELFRDYTANQQKLGEDRLEKKVISESQIFSVRLEAEKAQIAAERARFDLEGDKAWLNRLTGGAVLKDEEIPDNIPAVPQQDAEIQRLLANFLAQKEVPTVEAAVYRQSMELERLNLANQKTRLKPKFGLLVGANQDEQNYNVLVSQKYKVQSYYAGVAVNWTIFDGFSANAGVRASLAKVRQMEGDYRGLTERLAQQAQNQAKLVSFSSRTAKVTDRLYEAGESGLQTRREEFSRGVIAEEAVSVAQIDAYTNQITAYEARSDYFNQLSEFLGTVVEDPVLANVPNP
jgi:outer membrane protein TolC